MLGRRNAVQRGKCLRAGRRAADCVPRVCYELTRAAAPGEPHAARLPQHSAQASPCPRLDCDGGSSGGQRMRQGRPKWYA